MKEDAPHIIDGLRRGNQATYEDLFKRYYRPLTIFADGYLHDLEEAREVVQDLFVHLYENRTKIMITASLKAYLYAAVKNRCLSRIKQITTKRRHLEEAGRKMDQMSDLESEIDRNELENKIFELVAGLAPRCRNIFTLSRVDGLTNTEIAKKLGISGRTVETQISKALKVLRDNI